MEKREQRFFIAYLIWAVVELVAQLYRENHPIAHGVVKSILMPILIALVATTPRPIGIKIRLLLLTSLFFSWAGDVLLIFDDINLVPALSDRETFFMAGLGGFLVAQVLYIVIFTLHSKRNEKRSVLIRQPLIAVVMLIVSGIIFKELFFESENGVPNHMTVPVLLYGVALTGMVLSALNRRGRTHELSFWLVSFGAFSFLLSDTLIAFDHFHTPIDGMYVMTTYMIAQGTIVLGLLLHAERAPQKL